MTNISTFKNAPEADRIESEAASWIAQLDHGALSSEDKLALAEWMARSPRHAQEIHKLAELWGSVDQALDDIILGREVSKFKNIFAAWAMIKPKSFTVTLATVASLLVCGLFIGVQNWPDLPVEPIAVVYDVDKGESLTQLLSDGSTIHLNTDTVIEVQYTDASRTVKLLRGEGLFEVAKDSERPFEVFAGNVRVAAIGTAFIVRLDDEQIDVTVTEGKVRFDSLEPKSEIHLPASRNPKAFKDSVFIEAGHQIKVEGDIRKVVEIDQATMNKQTAWRRGEFVFSGDSLEDVVAEMGRYSSKTIIISDPALRERRVAGVYQTDSIDPILEALETMMNIKVEYARDDLIYLSQK